VEPTIANAAISNMVREMMVFMAVVIGWCLQA
jgi:hypothetical protein